MKRPGKSFRRLVAALVLGPPLLWSLVLACLPMGWARDRIVAKLEARTGQAVRLGKVRLRILGGVRLYDLEFAAEANPKNPWLKVASLVLDVSLRDLAAGRVSPTGARLSGVKLRLHRDVDGRLEFEDLFLADPSNPPKPPGSDDPERELAFRIEDSAILLADEATATRLELSAIEGYGTYNGQLATLDELNGKLNGGTIAMAARFDRAAGRPMMEGEVRAEKVNLGVGMSSLAYAVPLLATASPGVHARGILDLDLFLKSSGKTSDAVLRNVTGRGMIELDEMSLADSRIMEAVSREVPIHAGIGTLTGNFEVAKGRISTADTVLKVGATPVNLAGWSDFDGRLDYLVKAHDLGKKVQSFADKLPVEAREFLDELPLNDLDGLVSLEITGTIDRPTVRPEEGSLLSKKARLMKDPARRNEEKAKLKQAGKKLLDRLIR